MNEERRTVVLSRALGREVTVEKLQGSAVLRKVEAALLEYWRSEIERVALKLPGIEQVRAYEKREADDSPTWEFVLLVRGVFEAPEVVELGDVTVPRGIEQYLNCPPPIKVTVVTWEDCP